MCGSTSLLSVFTFCLSSAELQMHLYECSCYFFFVNRRAWMLVCFVYFSQRALARWFSQGSVCTRSFGFVLLRCCEVPLQHCSALQPATKPPHHPAGIPHTHSHTHTTRRRCRYHGQNAQPRCGLQQQQHTHTQTFADFYTFYTPTHLHTHTHMCFQGNAGQPMNCQVFHSEKTTSKSTV